MRDTGGTIRVSHCARASVLLEVLVTVTIIAMFMALIGGQILTSVKSAGLIERRQTAMMLAESIASRLQAGGFEVSEQVQQLSGTFDTAQPGWGWRVSTEPTDDPTLMRIHLEVLQGDAAQPDASVEAMTRVTDMYTFWAIPAKMNLADDFGLSDEDAAGLASAGIDVKNFNPASLVGLDLAELLKQYPQLESLLAMYGIEPSMLASMDPAMIQKALEAYMAANGGKMPNIPGLSGGAGGGNTSGGNAGGANGNNGNNTDNNEASSGSFDMGELARLLQSGDRAAAEAYARAHENDIKGMGGSGGGSAPSNNRPAGNSGGNRGRSGGNR